MKRSFLFLTLLGISLLFAQKQVQWTSLGMTSPSNQEVLAISAVDSLVVWGATAHPNFTGRHVFRTIDGGQRFSVFELPTSSPQAVVYQVFGLNADTAYAAVSTENGWAVEGIYRTHDGGTNWTLVFDNSSWGASVFQVHFFDATDGVAMGNVIASPVMSVFFFTRDGGTTWTQSISAFQSPCIFLESVGNLYEAKGDTVWYAGGVRDNIFRSIDRGQTWTAHPLPLNSNLSIQDVAFKDHLNGLALSSVNCGYGDTDNYVYHSTDGGTTWEYRQNIRYPFSTAEANNLTYIPGTIGAYMTTSGVLPGDTEGYLTVNNGLSWRPIQAPFALYQLEFINPALGYAGTSIAHGGLLRFDDHVDSIATALEGLLPNRGNLLVFPNPSSGSFFIELDNAWRGQVTLKLYNLLGQQLLEKDYPKPGQEARWELAGAALAPGRYQLVLSNGHQLLAHAVWVQ